MEFEMYKKIDLRSDTMTRPTPKMRRAMAEAEVGDDSYRDDPTVARLQAMAAEISGKEAAMLVLSGTMGNLVALLSQARSGNAILIEERSHAFISEAGHISGVCGLTPRTFSAPNGIPEPNVIEAAAFEDRSIHPKTTMLCLENSHNSAGGRCLSARKTAELCEVARNLGLKTHIDGARIFNTARALNERVSDLVAPADTVTFCLTKGLGAPVGALLCGPSDLLEEARRWRHMIGGSMRQAGSFAAAGIVALETGVERLTEDHENTKTLASRLTEFGLQIDQDKVETNIVYVRIPKLTMKATDFVGALAREGVLINSPRGNRVRFVLHRDVDSSDVASACEIVAAILETQ
jgi:threonine aldolase